MSSLANGIPRNTIAPVRLETARSGLQITDELASAITNYSTFSSSLHWTPLLGIQTPGPTDISPTAIFTDRRASGLPVLNPSARIASSNQTATSLLSTRLSPDFQIGTLSDSSRRSNSISESRTDRSMFAYGPAEIMMEPSLSLPLPCRQSSIDLGAPLRCESAGSVARHQHMGAAVARSSRSRPENYYPYTCVCASESNTCDKSVPARKAVSHIFGRNKRQTLAIPCSLWVAICRRHYQRESYRKESFPFLQVRLVLLQLDRLEGWGRVESFTVIRSRSKKHVRLGMAPSTAPTREFIRTPPAGRSAALIKLDQYLDRVVMPVDRYQPPATSTLALSGGIQRPLLFDEVRELLERVRQYLEEETDPVMRIFPAIEILPNISGPLTYTRGGRKRQAASASSVESYVVEDVEEIMLPTEREQPPAAKEMCKTISPPSSYSCTSSGGGGGGVGDGAGGGGGGERGGGGGGITEGRGRAIVFGSRQSDESCGRPKQMSLSFVAPPMSRDEENGQGAELRCKTRSTGSMSSVDSISAKMEHLLTETATATAAQQQQEERAQKAATFSALLQEQDGSKGKIVLPPPVPGPAAPATLQLQDLNVRAKRDEAAEIQVGSVRAYYPSFPQAISPPVVHFVPVPPMPYAPLVTGA
ncbi:uncharacterized protein V1516DRAFT_664630 [Lipomyces oligophaga]|uniref:uncharacterized protein n=1 Tax=Lipomyces oligophaga TaxID=45792 RepID=UPI0034CD42C9